MTARLRRLDPGPTDGELVTRIRSGETPLFEELMRRYNQRLFRVARAILRDDMDAEEVLQDAYVRAFTHLGQLDDLARTQAWFSQIVVHEAKSRLRRRRLGRDVALAREGLKPMPVHDPEQEMVSRQLQRLLVEAVDALPVGYRLVFVLREVEGMSTAEVADVLRLREGAVKTRLHRARAALRHGLFSQIGAMPPFRFAGERCDRLVAAVSRRIAGNEGRSR